MFHFIIILCAASHVGLLVGKVHFYAASNTQDTDCCRVGKFLTTAVTETGIEPKNEKEKDVYN